MSKGNNPFQPSYTGNQFSNLNVEVEGIVEDSSHYTERLNQISSKRLEQIQSDIQTAGKEVQEAIEKDILPMLGSKNLVSDFQHYMMDVYQRHVLFNDTLRKRGNDFVKHVEAGQPPLLAFDYELIMDGRNLDRPTNYSLVHILPRENDPETRVDGRPYIIIDPRAGHGSGIGGFKDESEVGCALREGHPVYFVIFSPNPVKGQTLGDVCASEAAFVREVRNRHKEAPHPIVIGNCQGGWGAMLLAATNPDITGPVVAMGTPLSYWAGEIGNATMRYLGGINGGMIPAMLMCDLAGGIFDGAHLVQNFESLNPGNTWWMKYYNAFAAADEGSERYLDFERWWSGFFLMNEEEIRWILENLFVGNKLARGKAFLDEGTHVDLRNIRSPIIIFASHGDNITPPQQALYWIADNYASVEEIKARGQRIVYTLHEDIGHLGIFVSSKIAMKQHKEIVSTLKTIESLAPGLYEMVITEVKGEGIDKQFTVTFEDRSVDNILELGEVDRDDEKAFATVSRMSELNAEIYDAYIRPMIKSMVTEEAAKAQIEMHPLRLQRYLISDKNPLLNNVPKLAEQVRENRQPAEEDNFFMKMEKFGASAIENWWNTLRDIREFSTETMFYSIYGNPFFKQFGQTHENRISDAPHTDLRAIPEVQQALQELDKGGFAKAVIRMLVFLANSRGSVRRDRLEKANEMMDKTKPFDAMSAKRRAALIHEQSIVVAFEPEEALNSLARMMRDNDRMDAINLCAEIAGPAEEMSDTTKHMFEEFAQILSVPNPLDAVTAPAKEQDNLAPAKAKKVSAKKGRAKKATAKKATAKKAS